MGGCVKVYLLSSKGVKDYGQSKQADSEQHGSSALKGKQQTRKERTAVVEA